MSGKLERLKFLNFFSEIRLEEPMTMESLWNLMRRKTIIGIIIIQI